MRGVDSGCDVQTVKITAGIIPSTATRSLATAYKSVSLSHTLSDYQDPSSLENIRQNGPDPHYDDVSHSRYRLHDLISLLTKNNIDCGATDWDRIDLYRRPPRGAIGVLQGLEEQREERIAVGGKHGRDVQSSDEVDDPGVERALRTGPGKLLWLRSLVSGESCHGHLTMGLAEPKGPRVRVVRIVGQQEESEETPDPGDDGIDHEEPAPSGKPVMAMQGVHYGGLKSSRHHAPHRLAGVVETHSLCEFHRRIPGNTLA